MQFILKNYTKKNFFVNTAIFFVNTLIFWVNGFFVFLYKLIELGMKLFSEWFLSSVIFLLISFPSVFSQTKFNYTEHLWESLEKRHALENEDLFFQVLDSIKIVTEKIYGFFPQEYRYFQYDLINQKYDTKKLRKAVFHYMRGLYFSRLDLFSKSFEEFQISRNTFQDIGAYLYVFDSYMMSAILSYRLKDSSTALIMFDNAKKIINKIDNDTVRWDRTAILNWNYGKYYLAFDKLDKAKLYLDSARRLTDFLMKLNCIYQVDWNYYIVYQNLSKYYVKKGLLDSALMMFDFLNSKLHDYSNLYPDRYEDLCQIYKLQKDYNSIIKKIEYLFQYLNRYSNTQHELIHLAKLYLYDDLADAYFNIGEKDKAYQILKELNDLNVKTRESFKPLQAINAKFELEGRLKEEELNRKITNIFFASITLIILISGLIYYNRFRKIRKLNLKLNELNETKNRLFRIISHDLRGPVTSNHQLLEQIVSKYNKIDDSTKINLLENIRNGTQNVANLLENLLNWSQFQLKNTAIIREEIPIRDTLKEIIDQTEYLSKNKNITINLDCISCDKIYMNKNEFEVLIRNLLTNALKFTPDGGNIDIKVNNQDGKITLEISDNGIGLSESIQQTIFKFDKHRKNGTKGEKGSGLGLIIVRDILERNNGNIEFKQNIPSGLNVRIEIPQNNLSKSN